MKRKVCGKSKKKKVGQHWRGSGNKGGMIGKRTGNKRMDFDQNRIEETNDRKEGGFRGRERVQSGKSGGRMDEKTVRA